MMRATLQVEHSAIEPKLYVALELGGTNWKLAAGSGGTKVSEARMAAGDVGGMWRAVAAAKRQHGLAPAAKVVSCYEAGRDGFWLHRELEARGVQNRVVDSSSIEVNRRARRAKTDRLDARKLLAMLWRYENGERTAWRVVRVPTVEQEDGRRVHRELERLMKERTAHTNRIRGLLAVHGVGQGLRRNLLKGLPPLTMRGGRPLPKHLRAEIEREWKRRELVDQQIRQIEAERAKRAKEEHSVAAAQVRQLMRLGAIGETSAWLMAQEIFAWRAIRNRREAAALVGLTPTPYCSDASQREQGISKNGNRHVRRVLVQISWSWLRYQPHSAISRWFEARFGHGKGRIRRVGIVAVARRLFIALWRFVDRGIVPEGALLKAA